MDRVSNNAQNLACRPNMVTECDLDASVMLKTLFVIDVSSRALLTHAASDARPADRKREWQRDSQQSPDDGRPSTSSQDSRRAKAKAEEEEKKLHSRDWSGIIPDQRTAPIPERRAEGICAFLRRIGKAVKLDCSEVDILVSTYPSCNPTDVQQDSSEFYWATPVHPCPSGVQLPVNADPDDPEHSCTSVLDPEPAVARDLELMSFSGLSSLSSIELTPDSIQDDPDDASSVPDFAESQTQKKKKDVGAFLRRKWRAMIAPAVEKQSRRRVKKGSFIQRTWKTLKVSALGCYGDVTVDPDPADLQPPISVLSRDLTEPGPSHREISSDQLPFSGPSHREISLDTSPFSSPSHREISSDQLPFSGPSHREISLDTSPFSSPSGSQSSFFCSDSSSAPCLTDLLSELSILMGDYEPVSS
ncbi:hypothetical protein F2P79_024746 [Pimephales promelas]|nr:hypothetical protein F2P79_024746 [Pimephales promelas]